MTRFKLFVSLALVLLFTSSQAQVALWTPLTLSQRTADASLQQGRHYQLDTTSLRQLLARAASEGAVDTGSTIILPLNNGEMQRFSIVESPIVAPGLAARYPDIKTYKVYGIDDPYASGRLSFGPQGFHGMISNLDGVNYIDPMSANLYRSTARKNATPEQPFSCDVEGHNHGTSPAGRTEERLAQRTAGSLNVYRLAVAGTAEYVNAVGGTVQSAQSQIIIAINRVNEIYERDLGIRLQIIANNDSLLYLNATTDPYTNSDGLAMLAENQANIDSVIGAANYDIGHVFSTGGGGIAQVGSVCTAAKAEGVTGLNSPLGDLFYIDFVAHEMGHQFDADHSFNGSTESCAAGREPGTAFEPGSGSTIMAYAGICGTENIAIRSDALFHTGSINQIDAFTTTGAGSTCGSLAAITNNDNYPVADAGSDYTIPVSTPFKLTGTATDADGDTLSYAWDQMDAGTATNSTTFGSDLGNNALMKSRLPRAEDFRYFPVLSTVLTSATDEAEVLPTTNRQMNFAFTVRDGKSGVDTDQTLITSSTSAGPFAVTSHSNLATLTGGASETVTWNVANTDVAPVNCSIVDIDILLMNTNRTTYCEESLASAVPNIGTANVTLPDKATARIAFKVSCSDNIFFALSTGSMAMNGSQGAVVNCETVAGTVEEHDVTTVDTGTVTNIGGGGGGGSSGGMGPWWLMGLSTLLLLRRSERVHLKNS